MLRDIEAILPQVPEKFVKLNFELYEYPIETGIGTRMAKSYLLSKDAFTLLTMGYTGEKAIAFKVAYIARFNEMERPSKQTPQPQTVLPSCRGVARRLPCMKGGLPMMKFTRTAAAYAVGIYLATGWRSGWNPGEWPQREWGTAAVALVVVMAATVAWRWWRERR